MSGPQTRLPPAVQRALRDLVDLPRWIHRGKRFAGKVRRRLLGAGKRVVSLDPVSSGEERVQPGEEGAPRGRVLLSYILDPFRDLPPDLLRDGGVEPDLPHSHTHFWETWAMARTWRELGFAVDLVSWQDREWMPEEPAGETPGRSYDVVIDVRSNLERWDRVLPPQTLRIFHADTAHHTFHNAAQKRRLGELESRRGARLAPRKLVEENRGAEVADVLTVLGNEFTQETYAFAGKPIVHVPVSVPRGYEWPREKDFATARRRFLWFGSGGLVHKGLDLVLEAFAGLPDLELVVCGPIREEADFELEYWRELYRTPNIRTHGWIDVESEEWLDLARRTGGLVYPSCSEGGGSSVYTCMHAGIVPLINREVSVDLDPSYSVDLEDLSVEGLRRTIRAFAQAPAKRWEAMARNARDHARRHHTKESFVRAYHRAAEEIAARLPKRTGP